MSKQKTLFSSIFFLIGFMTFAALSPVLALFDKKDNETIPIQTSLTSYTVKEGDTLFGIAYLFNTTPTALAEQNNLVHTSLFIGQILKVSDNLHLRGKTIAIDPGHGGYDTGAIQSGIEEQHATLDVSLKLKRHLESEGAKVILTRIDDLTAFTTLPLEDRATYALQTKSDIFVSIHFNSNTDGAVQGTETYYNQTPYHQKQNPYPSESKRLATHIQENLVSSIQSKNLGTKESDFHVLRNNTVPSTLVEVGFLSNSFEVGRIKSNNYKEKTAFGISQGIVHYFSQ